MKKLILLSIFLTACYCGFAQNRMKDSIVRNIIESEFAKDLPSIKSRLGPHVNALNNWANDALWDDPKLVEEVTNEIITYAIQNENDSLLSWSYHYLGLAYYYMDYWRSSIDIYQKALGTDWAINSRGANAFNAFCALNIGCNYELLGKYDTSVSYYYESIKRNEDMGLPYVAAESRLDLASLQIKMNNNLEARNNILNSLVVLKEFKDSVRISDAYRMLASIAVYEKEYKQAENYSGKAFAIATELDDHERLAKNYQSYGDALFEQSKIEVALSNFRKALVYCSKNTFPATYYQVVGRIGKAQLVLNQYQQAEEKLLEAFNGLNNLGSNSMLLEIGQNLSNLYAKNGNYEMFQHYWQISNKLKDSLAAIEKIRVVGEYEVIYKTAQKDKQIKTQDSQLNNREKLVFLISSIAVILIIMLFMLLFFLKKVRDKNLELLERNMDWSRHWDQIQGTYFSGISDEEDTDLFKDIYQLVTEKEEYVNQSLTLDYLARKLNSNSKYISQAIKEKTGMNFNAFVNAFRIEKAKKVLRSKEANKWNLEAIGEICGFNNNTTFYQTFKKNTGLTPANFRKIRF